MTLPAWLTWALVLAVLVLWLLGAHNRITGLKAAVLAAWLQVDAALQLRGQAVLDLLQAAAGPLAGEAAALDAVAGAQAQVQAAAELVRRAPVGAGPDNDPVADLGKADAVLAAVLVRLQALVEQQSALLADPAVAGPLKALREAPVRLAFARQVFNAAGSAYNSATQQFPTRLLGSLLRFGRAGRL